MEEQEFRHSKLDRLSNKSFGRMKIGRHELIPHPEKPDTYTIPGSGGNVEIGPHNRELRVAELGASHPAIRKYDAAVRGSKKERQYDADTAPGKSPVTGKTMGFATDAEKTAGTVAQNRAGTVKDTVDPRKKASGGFRQANYAGASSEMGNKNPADISAERADSSAKPNIFMRGEQGKRMQSAVKRGIQNSQRKSRIQNMMAGQNQQLDTVRANVNKQSAWNAVNKKRGQ